MVRFYRRAPPTPPVQPLFKKRPPEVSGLKLPAHSVERLREQRVKPPSLDPQPPPNDNSIGAVNDNNGDERRGSIAQG